MLLTPKQRQVLETIWRLGSETGYCPSYREIGEEMGTRPSAVCEHVNRLAALGAVAKKWNGSRSITLTRAGLIHLSPQCRCPQCGHQDKAARFAIR